MNNNLTQKQEAFCLAFLETGNASEAYRRAYPASRNWKEKSVWEKASVALSNIKVRSRVEELRAEITAEAVKRLEISKEWVLAQLVENVSMAKSAQPVLDHEGNPTGQYRSNLQAANRSLELIGKELGMFVDRKEIRTGALDDIPYAEKKAALDLIQEEIARRSKTVH